MEEAVGSCGALRCSGVCRTNSLVLEKEELRLGLSPAGEGELIL